jgi:membrane-associated phospholipid phosphatase
MSKGALRFDAPSRCWNSHYNQIRFRLMDINCVVYLGLIGLLLIFFHRTISQWPIYVLLHVGSIIIILELIRLGETHPQKRVLWILRTFYPIIIIMFGWRELDFFLPMFSGDYWFTDIAIYLDKSIFGVYPTVWAQQFYQPWLDELMTIFYSGYYLCIPLVPLVLFIKGKREQTLAAFSIITFTYFTNYLLFYLLPTTGPHIAESLQGLHGIEYQGFFVSKITRFILANGSVTGGAFPSSHISAMLVWSLIAFRYQKKLGYVLMLAALGVAVSAVYLGYHHAVDVFGGLILGILCYSMALALIKYRDEDPNTFF